MSTNAERLGKAVLARREELDMTQLDVWQAAGPSNTTLTKIESGNATSLARSTARKLDAALKWEPGSARRVWEGGEPRPAAPIQTDRVDPEFVAYVKAAPISEDLRGQMLAAIEAEERGQSHSETG